MPEIKWQVQLTYLVIAGETDIERLVTLMDWPIMRWKDPIKPGDEFVIEDERLDRFGPINVIQVFNMDAKAAISRAGLRVELVKIDLDAPGKLADPPPPLQAPRQLLRELARDLEYLTELSATASREEIQLNLKTMGDIMRLIQEQQ